MILLVVSSAKSKYIKMNSEDLAIRDELNTKKIVYEVRYSDAYILLYHRNRIVEDSRKLHRAYTTMYPTKVDIDPYGTNSLLVLQGHSTCLLTLSPGDVQRDKQPRNANVQSVLPERVPQSPASNHRSESQRYLF